jgi:hypothetical protein
LTAALPAPTFFPDEADVADWLEILKVQRKEGERMRREVPKMLADPAIAREQVMALFQALDKQAGFVERLVEVLEANGYEPDVVTAAERLEGLYAELAEAVAEKARGMAG